MLEENFKQIINIIKSDIKATGLKTAIQVNHNLIELYLDLVKFCMIIMNMVINLSMK